jgi:transcriptional regulator with PAS, ATPase and Fis domain
VAAIVGRKPQYFHLLSDPEFDHLTPILLSLKDRRTDLLAQWYGLYKLNFEGRRSLSASQFIEIFSAQFDLVLDALLNRDLTSFSDHIAGTGRTLFRLEVPFSELVVTIHLFAECARRVLTSSRPQEASARSSFDILRRYIHYGMILVAQVYSGREAIAKSPPARDAEADESKLPAELRTHFHGIEGSSASMRELYRRIEMAGGTRATIMVVGESGTGKELVARAIHACGDHASPFVALNCAALPKDLIESELFGYQRGAFTGADTEYLGLFRAANKGTLFLDEITEMAPDTQAKLLRAIQERRVRPVGATAESPVEVRLIASSNREPQQAVREGQLRHDLYYRLQANVIEVPPLREHMEDVAALVNHFIALFNQGKLREDPVLGLEEAALVAMMRYEWPGNVRELSNAIEGAFTFGNSSMIRLADLPSAISGQPQISIGRESASLSDAMTTFAETERDLVRRALESTNGNKAQAAKALKISRKKLYAKILKYHLE